MVRPYDRDVFCPVCGGVFEHDDARCDQCNRTRRQAAEDVEREVRLDEERIAAEMERASVRGISAPDY